MAQQKEGHKKVELHAFVYNEKLNQLKSDLEKIWLCDYQLIVTDLKKYVEQFCRNHQLEPEQQSQLEEYDDSPDDFRTTLRCLSHHLNQSGTFHIILIDEVDLNNVVAEESLYEYSFDNKVKIDLSYVAEFQNVHFIMCLRPTIMDYHNFKVEFPKEETNQLFVWFSSMYRNSKPIIDLISYVQESQSLTFPRGYPKIESGLNEDRIFLNWKIHDITCHIQNLIPFIPKSFDLKIIELE